MLPRTTILSDSEIECIDERIREYLGSSGVIVQHREMVRLLNRHGARVDPSEGRVRLPKDLIEWALGAKPEDFTLCPISGAEGLRFPVVPGHFYSSSITGAHTYLDPHSGDCRRMRLADVARWARLLEQCPAVDVCGFPTPSDVPPETADVHALRALLEHTGKHICIQPFSQGSVKYLLEMAHLRAGASADLSRSPIVSVYVDAFTPLQFKALDLEIILQACRCGVPIHASSIPTLGGTAPITALGAAVLAGIEVLSMLVMAQVARPGIPVLGLVTSLAMDMRTGKVVKSSLETIRTNAAATQFLQAAYGIPTHTCGFTSDWGSIEEQPLFERALMGLMMADSGVSIMGRAGELQAAKAVSPLQLILDDQLIAGLRECMQETVLDHDPDEWETIAAALPGRPFLESEHTLKHCRKGFRSWLSTRLPDDPPGTAKVRTPVDLARAKYEEMLEQAPAQSISPDIRRALDEIVTEADRELVRHTG